MDKNVILNSGRLVASVDMELLEIKWCTPIHTTTIKTFVGLSGALPVTGIVLKPIG